MRRGYVFPYICIIISIYIRSAFVERPCTVSGERESPTSESSRIVQERPGFGDHSDIPGEVRLRVVAERSGRGSASDSPGVARLRIVAGYSPGS